MSEVSRPAKARQTGHARIHGMTGGRARGLPSVRSSGDATGRLVFARRLAAAALVLLLALAAVAAAADEDDRVLETPPLGAPLPERMRELEREWNRDVGLPPDDGGDETDVEERPEHAEDAVDTDEEPVGTPKRPPVEEDVTPGRRIGGTPPAGEVPRPKSALERPPSAGAE